MALVMKLLACNNIDTQAKTPEILASNDANVAASKSSKFNSLSQDISIQLECLCGASGAEVLH